MNNKHSRINNREPSTEDYQKRSTTHTSIRVIAFATSNPNTPFERAYIQLEVLTRRDEWKREIIPASLLNRTAEFKQHMADKGYQWPSDGKQVKQIVETLVDARPKRHFIISFVPGWHGQSCVLPEKCYVQKSVKHREDRVRIMPKATVKAWGVHPVWNHRRMEKTCRWSVYAVVARGVGDLCGLCSAKLAAFGSKQLRHKFVWRHIDGKNYSFAMCGLGTWIDFGGGTRATWDATLAGLEQRALGHRDCLMPMDDLSFLAGNVKEATKLITFRLAGNRSRGRAGEYVASQDLVESDAHLIALSTSEDPIWAQRALRV